MESVRLGTLTIVPGVMQVTQDALAEVPAADALTEGGENPSEQRCTFLELALALAGSLDVAAISMLYKALKPALQVRICCPPCCRTVPGNVPRLLDFCADLSLLYSSVEYVQQHTVNVVEVA